NPDFWAWSCRGHRGNGWQTGCDRGWPDFKHYVQYRGWRQCDGQRHRLNSHIGTTPGDFWGGERHSDGLPQRDQRQRNRDWERWATCSLNACFGNADRSDHRTNYWGRPGRGDYRGRGRALNDQRGRDLKQLVWDWTRR